MSEALTIRNESDDVRLRVIDALQRGAPMHLEEFARQLNLEPRQLVAVFADPEVDRVIKAKVRTRSMLLLQHAIANRLSNIIEHGKDRDALAAMNLLKDLALGKAFIIINPKTSFDELQSEAAIANAGPLSRLTEIDEYAHLTGDLVTVEACDAE